MSTTRRLLLTALPKVTLSRVTGLLTRTRLPKGVRRRFYEWFARRYGADLDEVEGELHAFPSLHSFFRRPLCAGARLVTTDALAWPCDGKIVTAGPLQGDRIQQVKGHDYELADLLGDAELARRLRGGQQATIYLAPGDYHRVHSPFDGEVCGVEALAGTLFPVNPPAVRSIPRLFARNSRHVFTCKLSDGTPAAVVMVGAFNVGDTLVSLTRGVVTRGQELGQFGFGSTVVFVLGPGAPQLASISADASVRMGQTAVARTSG